MAWTQGLEQGGGLVGRHGRSLLNQLLTQNQPSCPGEIQIVRPKILEIWGPLLKKKIERCVTFEPFI